MPVPRSANNKGTYNLAVVRAPALGKVSKEPLLYLHGGPGIATLSNVKRYLASKTWEELRMDRPLIFFDYRGTGYSEPELCLGLMDSLGSTKTRQLSWDDQQSYKYALMRKCREDMMKEGVDVASFSSFQSAEDAEAIRKALGIDKWNVYGVSHGTTVALHLLRNHAANVSAMILDSPFPPNAPWPDFVRPFAESFKVLEKNIAADKANAARFPSVRKDFVTAVSNMNKEPYKVKINEQGDVYPVTGDNFAWSIWSAMLKPAAIPFVPLAIEEAAKGNYGFLEKWGQAFSDQDRYGKFSELQSKAILCYEGHPRTESDSKASLQKNYPDFTSFNLDFEGELCKAWQPVSAPPSYFEAVKSNVPVLILSGEYDPVCPPMFGELTAKTLSNSTFITVPAASHAAIHADDCVRGIAKAFIASPSKKVSTSCVLKREKIEFVQSGLEKQLAELNR